MASEKKKNYTTRYVAFMDILGFKNIVVDSATTVKKAESLISVMEEIADRHDVYQTHDPDDFRAQSFSDCIVMSENASPAGLCHLLGVVAHASLTLLEDGIFVRGGFAKGLLYHSPKVVLGPALVKAYSMESSIARVPRVLIDAETHHDLSSDGYLKEKEQWQLAPEIALGDDGPPFIDYLNFLRKPELIEDTEITIAKMRSAIEDALARSIYEPAHYEKMRWLAIYWNGVAAEMGIKQVDLPLMKFLK